MTKTDGVTKTVEVIFFGRDQVVANFEFSDGDTSSSLKSFGYSGSGCRAFLNALDLFSQQVMRLPEDQRKVKGSPEFERLIPSGHDHASILIREMVLKIRGDFKRPYDESELCHCRAVPTDVVDRAIVSGCHTVQSVARLTSAGTSCGTCKPDTERLIEFRLRQVGKTS